ncbi:MAG: nucleotidyltransferase family protein [Bacteriovorax sp.]
MKLSAEKQNFIIDCYLMDPAELATKCSLPETVVEREDFFTLASQNKIGANLYLQLNRLKGPFGAQIPNDLLHPLEETYSKIRSKNVRRLEVGLPILQEMKKRGVEVIVLKGNAIAEEIYQDIGYKPMNDIDILVKKEDMGIVYEVFSHFSLLTAAPLEEDIRKQEKYSHHAPPFFNKGLDVFLGTHWDIAAPTRGLSVPIQKLWDDKEEFLLMGERFFRLSPMHFIFHLCVHLNSAKTGLREVGDIVKMIKHREKELDSKKFIQLCIESKATEEIFEALSLVNSLRPFSFVKEVLEEIGQHLDETVKKRVYKRSHPRHKILHIRTNYVSKIEKTFALFMLTEAPLEKTYLLSKMWRLYLLVPPSEALKLDYEFGDVSLAKKMLAVLKAPLKISQVFINDLGLLIFIVVTMRHQWVLLASYGKYLVNQLKGRPTQDLNAFAKKLGLSFSEIKEIQALD